MTTTDFPAPRFNHVAMSVPADLLDADGRAAILDFYGEVFDWEELPTMTLDRERLILGAGMLDQFVFLIAEDEPMSCPRLDHFGMAVESLEQLQHYLGKAKAYAEKSDEVDLIDYDIDDHEVLKVHNFYVRFRLPLMVEVQFFELSA